MASLVLLHDDSDRLFARRLLADLEALGVLGWSAERDVLVGDDAAGRTLEAIREKAYAGVVLSPAAVGSPEVVGLLRFALSAEAAAERLKVLPILVADCEIPEPLLGRALADFRDGGAYHEALSRLGEVLGVDRPGRFPPSVHDPLAARAGRIESHYARPKRWHCIFCGHRCDDTNNDYLCTRCEALRPFVGGCATVARCNACGGYSLALARFCEWCGYEFAALQ